jgi:hypothetical protein
MMSMQLPPLQRSCLSFVVQLALNKAMSAGLLPAMSWADSGSLEIEMDAGPANPPQSADAMTEGDSAAVVAKVALAPVSLHSGNCCQSQFVMMMTCTLGCGCTQRGKAMSLLQG